MKKYLVLINSLYDQYEPDIDAGNIEFQRMLKSSAENRIYRLIRTLHLQSCLPFKSIWYAEWKERVEEYDTIVVADTGNTFAVIRDLKKHYPDKRIINWYRNPVKKTAQIPSDYSKYCEVWSFDQCDCEEFGLKFNPQFCMKRGDYVERDIENDAFFVGTNKGRAAVLNSLENELKSLGLKTKFCIVGYNAKRMTYKEVVEEISKSRIIVDIQSKGQDGFTLRPIEALLYKKKLITNNSKIKNADFYNPNNIFVIDKENKYSLEEFIKCPLAAVNQEVIERYCLKGWIDRFET